MSRSPVVASPRTPTMESLNTLATSLPTGQQKAEAEMANNFRSAALSITTLYRSSRQASKRAYNAGYAAACQDLLTMIQQGVSTSGLETHSSNGTTTDGMTIGKVMDWAEARLEEIRAREEEEDEEEEKEKEKEKGKTKSTPTSARPPAATTATATSRQPPAPTPAKERVSTKKEQLSLATSHTPSQAPSRQPTEPSTPSPPLAQSGVNMKQMRTNSKKESNTPSTVAPSVTPSTHTHPKTSSPPTLVIGTPSSPTFSFRADPPPSLLPRIQDTLPPSAVSNNLVTQPYQNTHAHRQVHNGNLESLAGMPMPITGAKRRHTVMMMMDSLSPTVPISVSSIPPSPETGADIQMNPYSITGGGHGVGMGMNTNSILPSGAIGIGHGNGNGAARRRVKNSRTLGLRDSNVNLNAGPGLDAGTGMAMDVEDDEGGRERKRVARR